MAGPRMLTTLLPQQERGHSPRGPPSTAPPPKQEHRVFLPQELYAGRGKQPFMLPAHRPITRPPLCSPPRTLGSQVPQLRPLLDQSPDPLPGATPFTPGPWYCSNGKTGLTAPPREGHKEKFSDHSSQTPVQGFNSCWRCSFIQRQGPSPKAGVTFTARR